MTNLIDNPSSTEAFGSMSKWIHWTMFLLFLFQYGIAIVMYGVATKDYYPKNLFVIHKSVGVLLFFLVIVRFIWRKTHPLPPWPETVTEFEKKSFHFFEMGLYALMFVMPISGYIFSLAGGHGFKFFGLFEVPDLLGKNALLADFGKYLHRITAFVIVGCVASHVSLILRHHYDSKDRFLNRIFILGSKKQASDK